MKQKLIARQIIYPEKKKNLQGEQVSQFHLETCVDILYLTDITDLIDSS